MPDDSDAADVSPVTLEQGSPNWIRIAGQEEVSIESDLNVGSLGRRTMDSFSQLFQVDHLSVLLGSGFTIGAAGLLDSAAPSMAKTNSFGELQEKVDRRADSTAKAMGRDSGNLEDQLRAALELHTGLEILEDDRAGPVLEAIDKVLNRLVNAVLKTEREVFSRLKAEHQNSKEQTRADRAHRILQSFFLSFGGNREATKQRLEIFTTNYDRLIEYCCDLTGLRIIDRFVGQIQPEFRSSRVGVDIHYSPPGMRGEPRYLEGVVRLGKLHGSVDWMHNGTRIVRESLRFGAEGPAAGSLAESLMVFPNAVKDVETAYFPYAELFRDMSAAICQPNSTLVTYGYGFGDDHVNRVIRDMLSVSATHLVVISYDDPGGRIRRFVESLARPNQVSILVGTSVAALDRLVEHFLPKPRMSPGADRRQRVEPELSPKIDQSDVMEVTGDKPAGTQ